MKQILIALLLAGAAATLSAQTNEPAARKAVRPIDYSARVQMHDVPVTFKTPDQLRREEERNARVEGLRLPDETPALNAAIAEPQVMPPPRLPTRRKEEDSPWGDKLGAPDQPGAKPEEPSGWGWLADQVRHANQQRTRGESQADERLADERTENSMTNRSASGPNPWPLGERSDLRDLAGRGAPSASLLDRPAADRDRGPALQTPDYALGNQLVKPEQNAEPRPWMTDALDRNAAVLQAMPRMDLANPLSPPAPANAGLGWATPDRQEGLFDAPGATRMMEPVLSAPTHIPYSLDEPTSLFQTDANNATAGQGTPSPLQPGLYDSTPPLRPALGRDPAMPGIQTKTLPW